MAFLSTSPARVGERDGGSTAPRLAQVQHLESAATSPWKATLRLSAPTGIMCSRTETLGEWRASATFFPSGAAILGLDWAGSKLRGGGSGDEPNLAQNRSRDGAGPDPREPRSGPAARPGAIGSPRPSPRDQPCDRSPAIRSDRSPEERRGPGTTRQACLTHAGVLGALFLCAGTRAQALRPQPHGRLRRAASAGGAGGGQGGRCPSS